MAEMAQTRSALLLAFALVLLATACGQRDRDIPLGHDVYAWAVDGDTGLDCSWFYFSTSTKDTPQPFRIPDPRIDVGAEWSPDGRWILMPQVGLSLDLFDARSFEKVANIRLPVAVGSRDVSWGPGSDRVAYADSSHRIQVLDISCVQQGESCQPEPLFVHVGQDPDWSPDGTSIAFAWDGTEDMSQISDAHIYTIDSAGIKPPTRLAAASARCVEPDWSPDGAMIAYQCTGDIFVARVDGQDPVNLTSAPYFEDSGWPWDYLPRWTPAGDGIAFLSDRGGSGLRNCLSDSVSNALFAVRPDGTDLRQVTSRQPIEIHWYTWITESR